MTTSTFRRGHLRVQPSGFSGRMPMRFKDGGDIDTDDYEAQIAALYADEPEPAEETAPETTPEPEATPEAITSEATPEAEPAPAATPQAITPDPTEAKPGKGDLSIALKREREERRRMQAELDALKQQTAEYAKLFEPDPEPVDPEVAAAQQLIQTMVQQQLTPLQRQLAAERQQLQMEMMTSKHSDFNDVTGLGTVSEDFPEGDPSHPVVASLHANPVARQQIAMSPNPAQALYNYAQSVMAMRPEAVEQRIAAERAKIQAEFDAKMKAELAKVAGKVQAGTTTPGSIAALAGSPTADDAFDPDSLDSGDAITAAIRNLYQGE